MDQALQAYRKVGVLGGMGPAATVDFMTKVINLTPAARDQDHVPMIIYNIPQVPDRTAAIRAGHDAPLAHMLLGVKALESAGADILVIACNTAHHWYAALSESTRLPILHIADGVQGEIREKRYARVGLMASSGTIMTEIYQQRIASLKSEFIVPPGAIQSDVDQIIYDTKAGKSSTARASKVLKWFSEQGADAVVLACTELPIAVSGCDTGIDLIDATHLLASQCVLFSTRPQQVESF